MHLDKLAESALQETITDMLHEGLIEFDSDKSMYRNIPVFQCRHCPTHIVFLEMSPDDAKSGNFGLLGYISEAEKEDVERNVNL